ncbi:addiction module protein [Hylemonella gracilis]|nr:addiction module protein [Hylemonella gracilis]
MTADDVAELPVAEKLKLMESLWDSLCAQMGGDVAPAWHGTVLEERLRRLDSGEEPIAPWAQAKERIRAQTKAV